VECPGAGSRELPGSRLYPRGPASGPAWCAPSPAPVMAEHGIAETVERVWERFRSGLYRPVVLGALYVVLFLPQIVRLAGVTWNSGSWVMATKPAAALSTLTWEKLTTMS